MNKTTEALKMAIDYLTLAEIELAWNLEKPINACKEALEQQAQEPVAYEDDIEEMVQRLQNWCEAYPTDIFPEITKEEIDYINAQNKNLSAKYFAHVGRHFIAKGLKPALDLLLRIYNTHPAQPLSDDEIKKILDGTVYCEVDAIPFARAIEQAHNIK
jgi:hypothetical protein